MKLLKEEHNLVNLFWKNFSKVDEGVYRSAQLLPWNLEKIIKKYDIKSVLNLRGRGNYLYDLEEEICKKLGVEYKVITISSRVLPSYEKLEELVNYLKNSKKPLLFHCKAGADRTGFVAVLWHVLQGRDVKWAVKKELKLSKAYISLSKAGRVKEMFLKYNNQGDFLEWYKKNRDSIQENFSENPFIDFIYEKILRRE
ncbi:tyrosine-protein phosphatase [Caminibacter mediatlanticus]|uniref:tyrosine-protein phosphatase n=1 Tax=Caminibacter mediatlanticus TaxID=291048 RepID=UPI00246816F9|nr:tyrosine-protein phosphatase [Caminibacter mediatlanticus]